MIASEMRKLDARSEPVTAEALAQLFSVLSDPTRIEMLRMLAESDEVACTTFDETLPISKSTISYHVKALRHAGLIRVRKDGKFYHYTLLRDEIERQLPGLLNLIARRPDPLAEAAAGAATAPELSA